MGLLNWLRGKRLNPESDAGRSRNLAFVLLTEPVLPRAEDVARHFRSFAAEDEVLLVDADAGSSGEQDRALALRLESGESCFVMLMPAAVPNHEADRAAEFSLCSFRNGWKLPPHRAHLIVTFGASTGVLPATFLSRFTSMLAAVIQAGSAVGVYWGNAGATHDAEFFVSLAREPGVVPRIMLWTGLSAARETGGGLSLLSLGMTQLGLPNLLLVAGPASADYALETMFDLLAYVTQRGEPIAEGDTVGRNAEQRLLVQYVESPVDPKTRVWRVELP
jgi:hypothetical protein